MSEAVFAAMQAPYRAQLDRDARHARALAEQAIAEQEAKCHWDTELARMRAEEDLTEKRAAADLQNAEIMARDQRRKAVLEAEQSVWVATANLKDVMVEDPRVVPGRRRGRRSNYRSVLETFASLAERGRGPEHGIAPAACKKVFGDRRQQFAPKDLFT